MKRKIFFALFSVVVCVLFTSFAQAQTVERYVTLDGTNSLVRVFNLSDNAQVAAIQAGATPNSVVFSPDGRLAYTANLNERYLSVIDLTIQAEIKRIRPVRADQLAISADGKTIVATDIDDESLTVVNTETLSTAGQIQLNGLLGDDPNSFDLSFNNPVIFGNKLYQNSSADIAAIDLGTKAITLLSGPDDSFFFQSAENLAITPDGKILAAIRAAGLVLIDTRTNTTVTTVPFDFAISVAAGPKPGNPAEMVGYCINFNFAVPGPVLDVVDLTAGSATFGQILKEAPLPAPLSTALAQVSVNADGSRVFISGSNVSPNLLILDGAAIISDPANSILFQTKIALQNRVVADVHTPIRPSATAPIVTRINKSRITNDENIDLRITGRGFKPGATVRVGSLDPIPATFISPSTLAVTIPRNAPSQSASIIVTNPSRESGILRSSLQIDTPGSLAPGTAVAGGFATSTINRIDPANDQGISVTLPAGPRPSGGAITPDGLRAYVLDNFQPAAVTVINLATGATEAHIVLNGSASSLPGEIKGLMFAKRPLTGKLVAYVVASRRPTLDLYVIDADPASPTFNNVIDDIPTNIVTADNTQGPLAITPDGRFAYIDELDATAGANLLVVDLVTRAVTTIPIATLAVSSFQGTMEISPDSKFIVLSADDGSFRIFDIAVNPNNPVLAAVLHGTIPPGKSAVFLGFPRIVGGRLFSLDTFDNVVNIFNFNSASRDFSELASYAVPGNTTDITCAGDVTPDGRLIYFPLREDDTVSLLDVQKILRYDPDALITNVGIGVGSLWVAANPSLPNGR